MDVIECTLFGRKETLRFVLVTSSQLIAIDENGEHYAQVSVSLPSTNKPCCIWLKDWSENRPLAEFLLFEGYLEKTPRWRQSGFVQVHECRMTDKLWEHFHANRHEGVNIKEED